MQAFDYRGRREISLPGQVVVLHPDELHDGFPATPAGFGYRQLYVEPALIFEAVRTLDGVGTLPFVRDPVVEQREARRGRQQRLSTMRGSRWLWTRCCCNWRRGCSRRIPAGDPADTPRHVDVEAVQRAREFLDTETTRVVHSASWKSSPVSAATSWPASFVIMSAPAPTATR